MDTKVIGLLELGTVNAVLYGFDYGQKLKFFSLSNRTAGDIAVSVYFVPYGGTPANANLYVPGLILAAHDIWSQAFDLPMENGAAIWGYAGSAGVNYMALFEKVPI